MLMNNSEYFEILESIKQKIRAAQYRAVLGMNREQIALYWNIGRIIIGNSKYGSSFVENLARDIKLEFPDAQGYSVRNLRYMRRFADLFNDFGNLQVPLADLTWYHNQALMDKVKDRELFLWYANKTLENGWSRDVLVHQIELNLYERQVLSDGKINNFSQVLPSPQSELARDTLKNPYVFDFIEAREKIVEREIKNELLANITNTVLELGTGFAYYGNEYHLSVGGDDFYIDLLFYNTKLRCYVVIELKTGKFLPEYAGKLNFYLSVIDDKLKHELDNPSIGILLCKERNKLTAEYALKDINKPIGVSEYKLSDFVPAELVETLPSVEDIEKRIKAKYAIEGDDECEV